MRKTDRKQFEIVGISIDRLEEKDLWKAAINKYNLSWINLNDPKASIASKLAIVNYPTKVLVDKNGKILLVDTDNSYKSFYKEIEKLVKAN
jgi:peroxiredoxin